MKSIPIGALAPLSRPGWVESGQHLLAGLQLAVHDINTAGGIAGRALELLVRDTSANPEKAAAAVEELSQLGVAAIVGEYHSVAARAAAAKADALGIPFLCSAAVIDALTDHPTDWVARVAPAQSHGWRIYADFLLRTGHNRIAVVADPSVYWASGTRILRDHLTRHEFKQRGATLIELAMPSLTPATLCDELANHRAEALLLLVGFPEPAVSIVQSVRQDPRLSKILIGAPAGQPELSEWLTLLGPAATAIPFLRYLPDRLTPLGTRVATTLRHQLAQPPSFVAFEGYDTILALAALLTQVLAYRPAQSPTQPSAQSPIPSHSQGPPASSSLITDPCSLISVPSSLIPDSSNLPTDPCSRMTDCRSLITDFWSLISVGGTRAPIRFSRTPNIPVWQWTWPPIQIADRDPANPTYFRTLHSQSAPHVVANL